MAEQPYQTRPVRLLRLAVPQLVTGSRVFFGAAAIIAVDRGDHYLAATLITFGGVTDMVDGLVARVLGVQSAFGALFDTFTDYLCFVVAPWALIRARIGAEGNIWLELLVGLPLLTAAIRYARNSLIIATETGTIRELPGLATVFFAFLPVAEVFIDPGRGAELDVVSAILTLLAVLFSLLMVTRVSYPKLAGRVAAPTAVLLVLMPFVGTRVLAIAMAVLGLIYAGLAPLLVRHFYRER